MGLLAELCLKCDAVILLEKSRFSAIIVAAGKQSWYWEIKGSVSVPDLLYSTHFLEENGDRGAFVNIFQELSAK